MPKVKIVTDNLEIEVGQNYCMLDLDHDFDTSVIFGCKDASCGSCAVIVLEGAENLSAMAENEKMLLGEFSAPSNARLACQSRVCGDITIKVHDLD